MATAPGREGGPIRARVPRSYWSDRLAMLPLVGSSCRGWRAVGIDGGDGPMERGCPSRGAGGGAVANGSAPCTGRAGALRKRRGLEENGGQLEIGAGQAERKAGLGGRVLGRAGPGPWGRREHVVRHLARVKDKEPYSDLYVRVCEGLSDSSKVIVLGFNGVSPLSLPHFPPSGDCLLHTSCSLGACAITIHVPAMGTVGPCPRAL